MVKSQNLESRLGQIFAFIITIAAFGLSTYLAILGYTTVAIAMVGITLGSVVTAFLVGKKEQREDLQEKKLED